jgi:hypothetical protein
MARKTNGRESDPSTANNSAHEDVEMQDQDKIEGFKKFGVSGTQARNVSSRRAGRALRLPGQIERRSKRTNKLTLQSQYNLDTPDYTVCAVPTKRLAKLLADQRPGLGHTTQHHS